MENLIEINNISKKYKNVQALDNLSLRVERGDFFGFIGPNGAGKSTTIKILLGLLKKDSGEIKLLGTENFDKTLLNDIGYLPSEIRFYNNMKVLDILKYSAGLRKLDCTKEAEILCERLQLDTNKRISELSLGNKKKVGIVCALQHFPKLYILDEPTSGLDPLIQKEFFEILKERHKDGATIFLSSHILSEIEHYCNKAAIIKNGKLVAFDKTDNLLKSTAKKVSIKNCQSPLKHLNVESINIINNVMSFIYYGDSRTLIHELDQIEFSDVSITDLDLEEIFLHYYQQGEATQ